MITDTQQEPPSWVRGGGLCTVWWLSLSPCELQWEQVVEGAIIRCTIYICVGFYGWLFPGVSEELGGGKLIQNDAPGLGGSKDMEGTLLLPAHG